MNELDLQLFEILDSEIDKSIGFGKVVKHKGLFGIYCGIDKDSWINIYETNGKLVSRVDFGAGDENEIEFLGHYPGTNEILRYCVNNGEHLYSAELGYEGDETYISIQIDDENIHLDIKTPLKDQTDEQKKDIIKFINLIK